MRRKSLFGKSIILLALNLIGIHGEELNAQTVTFYTPRTVRVEKPQDGQSTRQSLVVIAQPEKVKVKQSTVNGATVYKSAFLTVTVKDGKVSFADNHGNMLTSEVETRFTPITQGPDKGAFKVKQSFS